MNAYPTYVDLINNAKTKDAALSQFDRNKRKGMYDQETLDHLTTLFEPLRIERRNKRTMSDIGGVAEKRIFKKKDVEYNVKLARQILSGSGSRVDVLLALLLMTGRRTSEVVGNTQFTKAYFTGTLKGGHEQGDARYLCSFERIQSGLKVLKATGWRELEPDRANDLVAVPLLRRLQIFKGVEKVHDLRKMHVAIWLRRLKNRKRIKAMNPNDRNEFIGRFVNDILGHTNPVSAIPYLNCEIK